MTEPANVLISGIYSPKPQEVVIKRQAHVCKVHPLFVAAAVIALATSSAVAAIAKTTEPAILLTQESRIQGHCELLYSKTGIKLTMPKKNLVLCMQSPTWRLSYYNPRTKRCFQCDPRDWNPNVTIVSALLRPGDSTELKPVSVETRKLMGLVCKRWQLKSATASSGSKMRRSWQRQLLRAAEFWVVETKDIPEVALKAVGKTLVLPPMSGIPLACSRTNVNGDTVRELRLLDVSKVKASSSDFALPPGIKRVSEQGAVIQSGYNDLQELIE